MKLVDLLPSLKFVQRDTYRSSLAGSRLGYARSTRTQNQQRSEWERKKMKTFSDKMSTLTDYFQVDYCVLLSLLWLVVALD